MGRRGGFIRCDQWTPDRWRDAASLGKYSITAVQQNCSTAVHQYRSTAVQQYSTAVQYSSTVQQYSTAVQYSSTVQQYNKYSITAVQQSSSTAVQYSCTVQGDCCSLVQKIEWTGCLGNHSFVLTKALVNNSLLFA